MDEDVKIELNLHSNIFKLIPTARTTASNADNNLHSNIFKLIH